METNYKKIKQAIPIMMKKHPPNLVLILNNSDGSFALSLFQLSVIWKKIEGLTTINKPITKKTIPTKMYISLYPPWKIALSLSLLYYDRLLLGIDEL